MSDGNEEGHYVFCIGRTEYYYTLVNDVCTKDGELLANTINEKHRNTMKKMLSYANIDGRKAEVWLV
jgi:hypothetical protein